MIATMLSGAIGGGALAGWLVLGVARRRRTTAVRRRLPGGRPRRSEGSARRRPPPAALHHGAAWLGGAAVRPVGPAVRPAGDDDDERLAESCDTIARALRGGRSLSAAVADAADRHRHPALLAIGRATGVGEQLPRAIDDVARAASDADVVLVVQVLAVAAEHGGSQAEAIDRAAATLRERRALRAERRAQAASARLSTRVMTILPFGFTGFVALTDPDVREVLVRTPVGWTCLAVGAALNLAGRAWAKRAVAA